ncbi:MAG: hypothetical protein ACI9TH_005267 [Kiritimatiellia bacterium]|jgi:hypothetical protein
MTFATELRIPNPCINIPAAPPATTLSALTFFDLDAYLNIQGEQLGDAVDRG